MKETNMEHFRSELEMALAENRNGFAITKGKITSCGFIHMCTVCDFNAKSCNTDRMAWLMSEYKEEPVLTAREKHFVEFAREGWLARDIDGVLHWFMREPDRCKDEDYRCWNGPVHAFAFKKLNEIFPFITWEDEEAWAVEDLRKLKVKGGEADEE